MIRLFLQKLRQRFSRSPNVMQARGSATLLPFKSLRPHWILGRGLCMYRCENFDHVPRGKREAALRYQVPNWSPFDRTSHLAVWSGGDAMVWYWDADIVDEDRQNAVLSPAGVDGSGCHVLPETLFRPRGADGVQMQQCAEGFEVQYWRGGVLRNAFWSTDLPSAARLAWFADREGIDAEARALGPPLLNTLLTEPWSAQLSPRDWLVDHELRLVAGLALLFSALLVWQGARHWKYSSADYALQQTFQAIQDEVVPLMQARNEYLALRKANEQLAALLHEPSQALLMGLVDGAMPNEEASFSRWHYQEGELSVVVVDARANPVEYVQLLEEQPAFTNVRLEQASGRNRIRLTMQVAL